MPSVLIRDENGEILYLNENQSAEEALRILSYCTASKQPDSPASEIRSLHKMGTSISAINSGEHTQAPSLSCRESQVLRYIANALSPEQTAIELGIKVRTVRKHLSSLRKKFGTQSRDQLMARAGYLGLCDPYDDD
jgi:DNA-binding CsgD family transcriptional regulator